jgi:hypothetical protein
MSHTRLTNAVVPGRRGNAAAANEHVDAINAAIQTARLDAGHLDARYVRSPLVAVNTPIPAMSSRPAATTGAW